MSNSIYLAIPGVRVEVYDDKKRAEELEPLAYRLFAKALEAKK